MKTMETMILEVETEFDGEVRKEATFKIAVEFAQMTLRARASETIENGVATVRVKPGTEESPGSGSSLLDVLARIAMA